MSQGFPDRYDSGIVGTAGAGDVINFTLPIDPRFDVVPNSVRIYVGGEYTKAWESGTLVAIDNGSGILVGQGAFTNVTGTFGYTNGAVQINENADNPFDGSANSRCWVECYQRWPGNTPADDFDFACGNNNANKHVLKLTRYAHSAFGSKNLLNHGAYCLRFRADGALYASVNEYLLKNPDFDTDKPIMSEIAMRFGDTHGVFAARIGPRLIQRCESDFDIQRTGYWYGPIEDDDPNWELALMSGQATVGTQEYNEFWNGSTHRARWNNSLTYANIRREFSPGADNIPPNINPADWHKLRMTTSIDGGDMHIHLQMALGHTEVDKAFPVFVTVAQAWHQVGNDTVIWTPGITSVADVASDWNGDAPHALPPVTGRQGFSLGGSAATGLAGLCDQYVDDFRAYRMP